MKEKLNTIFQFALSKAEELGVTKEKFLSALNYVVPVKLKEEKTKEGAVISYEGELAEKTAVFVVGADGAKMPAPDGDHTLENGDVITVAAGIVTAIKKAEPAPAPADLTAQMNSHKQALEVLAARLAAIEKRNADLEKQTELQATVLKAIAETPIPEVKQPKPIDMNNLTQHQKYQLNKYGEIKS